MNVNKVLTKEYENIRPHSRAENKPNQTQFSHKNFSVIPLRQNLQLRGPATLPKTPRRNGFFVDAEAVLMHTIQLQYPAAGYWYLIFKHLWVF